MVKSKMALFGGYCFFTKGLAQRQGRGRGPVVKKSPVSPNLASGRFAVKGVVLASALCSMLLEEKRAHGFFGARRRVGGGV